MKRYDFYQPGYGEPDYMEETSTGEYVKFEDAQALIDYHRGSCMTLTEKYSQLMDQYMELKGQMAKLELIQKNSEMAETAYRNRVQAVLASPSEAKGDTPDEPTTCLGIIKYGICSCGQHRGDIP